MKRRPRPAHGGVRPAPALLRLGAFGLDQIVIVVYLGGLFGLSWALTQLGLGSFVREAFEEPLRAQLLGLFLLTLPVVMYQAAWEGSPLAATPGKLLLGVRVAAEEGGALPLERAMLRAGVKALPWEISHTVLWRLPGWPGAVEIFPPGALAGLALVWVLVGIWLVGLLLDTRGRTAYDRAAGAVVVRGGSRLGFSWGAQPGFGRRPRLRTQAARPVARDVTPDSIAASHPRCNGVEL